MQIACPNCAASYEIETSSLGEDGRMVRCARCKEIWLATAPQLAVAAAAAPSLPEAGGNPRAWPREARGGAGIAPEDRFGGQASEIEFAVPGDMPEIAEAPPIAPQAEAEPVVEEPAVASAPDPAATGDAEEPDYFEVRRRRQARRVTHQRKAPIFTKQRMIAAMAIILVALVLGREYVARAMPQTASLYAAIGLPVNLRGLEFEGISGAVEQQDGVPVLVIEGAIRNVTRAPMEVPRLRFAVRNAAGAEIYSWTALPERPLLRPGEVQTFRSRLASPPADGRQAQVRFLQRSDIVANDKR